MFKLFKEIIRLIFKLYLEGMRTIPIAEYLNARGIATPTQSKKTKNTSVGKWHAGHVSIIIRNRAYIGEYKTMQRSKKQKEGRLIQVPAIVGREDFDKANRLLIENADTARGSRGREYLLRGLIYCGGCGRAFIGSSGNSKEGRVYYRCSGVTNNGQGKRCNAKLIRAADIENAVWSDIQHFLNNPDEVARAIERTIKQDSEQLEPVQNELNGIENGLLEKQVARQKILSLVSKNIITDAEAEGELLALARQIETLNHRKEQLMARMEQSQELSNRAINISLILKTLKDAAHSGIAEDKAELLALFSELEFKTLIRSIMNRQGEGKKGKKGVAKNDFEVAGAGAYTVGYITINDESSLKSATAKIKDAAKIALALEGDRKSGLKAAALSIAGNIFLLPLEGGRDLSRAAALAWLKEICGNPDFRLLCHNAKEDMWRLKAEGIKLGGLFFDTMIAAYLLNPATSSRELTEVALEYLKIVLPSGIEAALPARAEAVRRLHGELSHGIEETGMGRLYYEVELPLVTVLAEMEMTGVKVDRDRLNEMSLELGEKIQSLSAAIHSMAGEEFNINSTKQLGYILFERLQLPVIKRTKTGYSTDAAVLEELAGSHEIVAQVLEHRQMVKLKSTYVDGFSPLIDPETGLLHTTFHQDVTATGRLSSAEPNLQNIPIKMEEGRKIRKVFLPRREGNIILSADYSQIELRILAHMSADPLLVEAFRKGEDIHARTASEVFGVNMEQVTREMRGRAKAVNFGIIYGISDFGLSRDIKVPRREAKLYIEGYFNRYRGVKNYIDRIVAEAREKGYVTTLLNRRRYLPDLFSSNHTVRSFGERTAMNTPIQGTAADIIKMAMVRIQREIVERGLATKMILQVHDELIFDVPLEEFEAMKELVKTRMENALALDVPLVVDMKAGQNWYEVKVIK